MKKYEYHVHKVSGWFVTRSAKAVAIRELCESKGPQGWDLVSVTYDWFMVSYLLIFKRETDT